MATLVNNQVVPISGLRPQHQPATPTQGANPPHIATPLTPLPQTPQHGPFPTTPANVYGPGHVASAHPDPSHAMIGTDTSTVSGVPSSVTIPGFPKPPTEKWLRNHPKKPIPVDVPPPGASPEQLKAYHDYLARFRYVGHGGR